jgi:hypothetical protein
MDAFTVTVKHANRPPVAVNDIVEGGEWFEILIPVLENDYDPEGDALRIVWVSRSIRGVQPQIVGDWISYRIGQTFQNFDRFYYTIEDEHGAGASATVIVIIHDLPASTADEE